MFIPGITTRSSRSSSSKRRLGLTSFRIGSLGLSKIANIVSIGSSVISIIQQGLPFAGRSLGGGQRPQIFGNQTYGSGYGDQDDTRGVAGRNFPFYFWPVVWDSNLLLPGRKGAYLNAQSEYGGVGNDARPGGVLSTARITSRINPSTIFTLLSDSNTVISLVSQLVDECPSDSDFNDELNAVTPLSPNATTPRPEQVVQYYRASSIALTLDGYNNTATYAAAGAPNTPLPSGIDTTLLNCVNGTIGKYAPLVTDGGLMASWTPSFINLVGLAGALWALLLFT
ncbi:hypothetical protein NP233_g3899 [Leucocoprinus birnbaumii]|uniref:Uncharacterized protein n=1 Tax=Leucocoprinus birnbaumii TaxID=56174 RepID=A0AAD5VZH4_9AGAR|nr:hypothetical protein NP233_g3899 [Leucocoprinus birnbaumii]